MLPSSMLRSCRHGARFTHAVPLSTPGARLHLRYQVGRMNPEQQTAGISSSRGRCSIPVTPAVNGQDAGQTDLNGSQSQEEAEPGQKMSQSMRADAQPRLTQSQQGPRRSGKVRPGETVVMPASLGSVLGQLPGDDIQEAMRTLLGQMDEGGQRSAAEGIEALEDALDEERLMGMDDEQLKAHVDVVMNKYNNPSFWEATLMQPLELDIIRERLSPEDSDLLGKLLVSNEQTGDVGRGLNTNRPARIGRALLKLKLHERRRLPGLLARLEEQQKLMQEMGEYQEYTESKTAIRLERRARQKGLIPEEEEQEEEQTAAAGPDVTAADEAPRPQAGGVGAAGQRAGGGNAQDASSTSSGPSTSGTRSWGQSFMRPRRSNAAGSGGGGRTSESSSPLGQRAVQIASIMADGVQRYMVGDGWAEEEALKGSPELRRLKILSYKLASLAELTIDSLEGSGLTPRDFLEELKGAMREVQLLAAMGPQMKDPVVRDTVMFLRNHLKTQDEDGDDVLDCEPVTIYRLMQFIKAAEAWQLCQAFYVAVLVQQEQTLTPENAEEHLGRYEQLENAQWWLMSASELADGDAAEEGEEMVLDQERIESLAAMDTMELGFLSELLASGFSEEVLLKWSLHPELGPKLRSGQWFDENDSLPNMVKEAMQEAMGGNPIQGIDFQYKTTPGDPPKPESGDASGSRGTPAGPSKSPGPDGYKGSGRAPGVPPSSAGKGSRGKPTDSLAKKRAKVARVKSERSHTAGAG